MIQLCWDALTKKMAAKIQHPRAVGHFVLEDGAGRGMRCVEGLEEIPDEGQLIHFFWLVDETDGMILDAKFQAFGSPALIAAAEVSCELVIGKNHDQAKRISADLIDKQLRDTPDQPAFSSEVDFVLNLVLDAIDMAAERCHDLPLPSYQTTPVPCGTGSEQGGYPDWHLLSYEKKIEVIEKLLDEEVRPYIELDAGGIDVVKLVDDRELIVAYKGACTSCYSSIGTTLSTIQNIVQSRIDPNLMVVPNLDDLNL